jgi:hypothetical protein
LASRRHVELKTTPRLLHFFLATGGGIISAMNQKINVCCADCGEEEGGVSLKT